MIWANFLHFYQPSNQQKDILDRIVNESYRPLMKIFMEKPRAKASFNINGGLLELLEQEGYEDVIENLRDLLKRGQIELTGSAKYHAFLPLIPASEVRRQIQLNEKTFLKYWGDLWKKKGFFPPELAYDYDLAKVVYEMGYEWIVAPQIAYGVESPAFDRIYQIKGLGDFKVYFRHKQGSVLILSGIVRSVVGFCDELGMEEDKSQALNQELGADSKKQPSGRSYVLTIMDAETFGHHRPGLDKIFVEFLASDRFTMVQVSDLPEHLNKIQEVEPRASTWSNEEQDFWLDKERKVMTKHPFLLWRDPVNPIHRLQWEFAEWVIDLIKNEKPTRRSFGESIFKVKNQKWVEARKLLDKVLSSDQFWWASAKPWWSLEMIESGAWQMKRVIKVLCGIVAWSRDAETKIQNSNSRNNMVDAEVVSNLEHSNFPKGELGKLCSRWLTKAEDYYRRIMDQAFEWQRTGKIRQAHKEAQGEWKNIPFKKRTPAEWYNQVVLEFEDEMKKAAEKFEFEKAIKWRDAIIKLKSGMDVYDVLHVVDELHSVRRIPSLKPFLEYKDGEISEFAKKHFLPS